MLYQIINLQLNYIIYKGVPVGGGVADLKIVPNGKVADHTGVSQALRQFAATKFRIPVFIWQFFIQK